MLELAGAAEVLAIEANTRAFLKCLCITEVFKLQAVRFLLGDGMAFMEQGAGGFDMVFASGTLYHLQDPLAFLRLLRRMAPRALLWTPSFDDAIIRNAPALPPKFGPIEQSAIDGFTDAVVEQSSKEALQWRGLCGGSAPTSRWLTRRTFSTTFDTSVTDASKCRPRRRNIRMGGHSQSMSNDIHTSECIGERRSGNQGWVGRQCVALLPASWNRRLPALVLSEVHCRGQLLMAFESVVFRTDQRRVVEEPRNNVDPQAFDSDWFADAITSYRG